MRVAGCEAGWREAVIGRAGLQQHDVRWNSVLSTRFVRQGGGSVIRALLLG